MDLEKRNGIIERINDVFVSDFDLLSESKDKINNYLTLLDITNIYDYNSFCIDIINFSKTKLDEITDTEFQNLTVDDFITEILEQMVKNKIINSDLDEFQIKYSLMRLELDKFMMKKNK